MLLFANIVYCKHSEAITTKYVRNRSTVHVGVCVTKGERERESKIEREREFFTIEAWPGTVG